MHKISVQSAQENPLAIDGIILTKISIDMRSKFVSIKLLLVLDKILWIQCLSCAEILEFPADKTISLSELHTVPPKDMVECLAHLSKSPLPRQEAEFIWQTIVAMFGGIENIPDKVLMILHYVTIAVKPEEYANITLSNIEVIENFGLDYNLDQAQLSAIADRVREDFAGKEPEDYTFYDLIALKQILCQFNRSEIERIHPSAYREAAATLGKLKNCNTEAMTGFAALAVQKTAFGSPNTWTQVTLKILGNVAEFLPPQIVKKITMQTEVVPQKSMKKI